MVGDLMRILPCDHTYHKKCIDPWLLKNKRVCPQCRKKVFAAGEVPPSDSESETEDERRPLLARPARQTVPSGTFSVQRENLFRRQPGGCWSARGGVIGDRRTVGGVIQ